MKPIKILAIKLNDFVDQTNQNGEVKNQGIPSLLELVRRVINSEDIDNINLIIIFGMPREIGNGTCAITEIDAIYSEFKRLGKSVIVIPDKYTPCSRVPITKDNIIYLTCAPLSEEPFKYTIITLKGNEFEIEELSLILNDFALSDFHVHTNYAYCSENVEPEANIRRAKQFGLKKVAFTEHAGQLYVIAQDYWSARYINEPDLIQQNRNTPFNRMKKYRTEMEKYRSKNVLIGLEVEVDCNGNLTLLEEDAAGWDILLGAVHNLPRKFETGSKKGFIWATEALLRGGVDVLAHPFRYFLRNKLPVPEELYRPVAELLAQYNTAVELNYHTNNNDPKFFEICVDLKVPISLGSDAHNLCEVGALTRHLKLLEDIGALDKLSEVLYKY